MRHDGDLKSLVKGQFVIAIVITAFLAIGLLLSLAGLNFQNEKWGEATAKISNISEVCRFMFRKRRSAKFDCTDKVSLEKHRAARTQSQLVIVGIRGTVHYSADRGPQIGKQFYEEHVAIKSLRNGDAVAIRYNKNNNKEFKFSADFDDKRKLVSRFAVLFFVACIGLVLVFASRKLNSLQGR